ncbi:MAG: hypothetical protein QM759_09070 [Terricaulis sp.]
MAPVEREPAYITEARRLEAAAGFDTAVTHMAADLRNFYRDNPLAARIFADVGQLAIVSAIVAAPAPVSEAALCRHVGAGALASRQRVRRHLAKLREHGLIAFGSGDDLRARPITPTTELEQQLSLWVCALAQRAVPLFGLEDRLLRQPQLARLYLSQIAAAHVRGFSAFAATPNIARIVTLSRGHALAVELLVATIEARDAVVAFSRRSFGATFGVSRTHVVDLLNECAKHGLLKLDDDARLSLSSAFIAEARLWAAINFTLAGATLRGELLNNLA